MLSLATALIAIAASQAAAREPAPGGAPTAQAVEPSEPAPEFVDRGVGGDARVADPVQTGIPFQTYATVPPRRQTGAGLDVGVGAAVRSQTLTSEGAGGVWGTDVEVTPGIAGTLNLPGLQLAGGYAARLTFPINSGGETLAVLNQAYFRLTWQAAPLWTIVAEASAILGDNSQLVPITTPGGSGPPPPVVSPVRTFSTYPYIGLLAALRAGTQFSARTRLRVSVGYSDVGGTGEIGAAAQPRTWGPSGEAIFEWDSSRTSMLATSLAVSDSIMSGQYSILIGALRETWSQRWTPDLETTVSAGAALSNTDSVSFLSVGRLLPVAGAGLRYFTDVRHEFRLSLDAGLGPYVDPYIRVAYQRIAVTFAVDWYPTKSIFVGGFGSAAWVPYSVQAPESYGTAGASAGWEPWKILTVGVGAFSQAQFQGTAGVGVFKQWTLYGSLTLREHLAF
jgi:hypothetical protein